MPELTPTEALDRLVALYEKARHSYGFTSGVEEFRALVDTVRDALPAEQ